AGVRHGTRFEPTVEHLLDTAKDTLALLGGNGDVVDAVSVEIGDILNTGKLLELLDGANTDHLLLILGHPNGQRSTPISVTGDVPVTGVRNPVGETVLLDV